MDMASSIAQRVAARYWDPEDRASAEQELVKDDGEKESSPQESRKSSIAERIVRRIVIATEYTLALSVGQALRDKIFSGPGALFPSNYFSIKDTHAGGVKAFEVGSFSFGLEPLVWVSPSDPRMKILASGSTLLIWGTYPTKHGDLPGTAPVQSTKPADSATPWSGNPAMADESLLVRVYAGYYNKLKGGSVKQDFELGRILVQFDAQENATVDVLDPAVFKKNLEDVVTGIQANPPPEAIADEKSVKAPPVKVKPLPTLGPAHSLPEYATVKDFIDFVVEHGDTDPGRNKHDAGGRAVAPGWIYGTADVNLLAQNTGMTRRDIEAELNAAGLAKDESFRLKISTRPSPSL